MKKQILIYLALALLLPLATAFDCSSLGGGDFSLCDQIQNTNLSSYEKDLLISDIFNKNKTSPNFDFIYSWNTNLNILNSPDGITSSSGTINTAWIKITALMPSIIENNTLYASDNGKLLTAYNYNINLSSGIESGDCKTNYYANSNSAVLNVYLNDQFIGNEKISAFLINYNPENLNFISRLTIQSNFNVEHYKTLRYCCKYSSGGSCLKHCNKCAYSSTESRTDSLTLEDSLNAKLYKSQLNSSFRIINKYYNLTQGELNATNFTKLLLSFNNSFYQTSKYTYSLNYTLPYYILTLRADPIEITTSNNIHLTGENNRFLFTIQDFSNCKIQLFDHFNSITQNCDMSFNKTDFSIKTDRISYFENDTIKVYIFPEDLIVSLSYANQSKTAKNYTEFKAVLYENKISAKLNGFEEKWLINVKKKENTDILHGFIVLSFLVYFFYRIVKVYSKRRI